MTTFTISTSIDTGVTLLGGGTYGSPLTVTSTGQIDTAGAGIYVESPWSIVNQGSITGGSGIEQEHGTGPTTIDNAGLIDGTNQYGIELNGGGAITNAADATIAGGYDAIRAIGGAAIYNAGLVTGEGSGYVIALQGGPTTLTNASTGTISGSRDISAFSSLALDNAGTITETGNNYNVRLRAGGSITNEAGGVITGGGGVGGYNDPLKIVNYGTIIATNAQAVILGDGGVVTNAASATISGTSYGVGFGGGSYATLENAGTIIGSSGLAVKMFASTNLLAVDAGAVFQGTVEANSSGTNTVELTSGAAAGAISGIGTGAGYQYQNFQTVTIDSGATWSIGEIHGLATVDNSGVIIDTAGYGVVFANDGSVTNASGASIGGNLDGVLIVGTGTVDNQGAISGGNYGVYLTAGGSVDNSGSVYGQSAGIYLRDSGSVTNESTGSIGGEANGVYLNDGGSVTNASGGTITGSVGIGLNAGGTVDNLGGIYGQALGIYLHDGGSITNGTAGSIGGGRSGVFFKNGGSVTNETAGTIAGAQNGHSLGAQYGGIAATGGTVTIVNDGVITGNSADGIKLKGTSGTVENAGTIIGGGGVSVYLGESVTNRLIIDAGAKFTGIVEAVATAANTIELTTGASVGTISGLGTQYTGFQTVAIDTNAAWNVGGTTTAFENVTIDGFNSHDRLDLTDIGPAGYTVSLNSTTDLLTIEGSSDTITIQFDSSVSGDTFQLLSDGHSGTFVEESDYTPCYCRGTRIRTPKGEVAVEALKVGDRIVTADGNIQPIKWIGRRFYRDWLAAGNADVQPILFKAGSIADHVPVRDLYVSPEHAMFLDGMLIPALHLVNGTSIVKVEGMEEVEYFHLEFDRHVVIFAEGATAESFVDDDSRMLFHNADEYLRLYPDEPRNRHTAFCAPRVEAGAALETTHRRLTARAERLRPDGTAGQAIVQHGYLDRATHGVVAGWAFAGAGEGPVRLAILVNGAVVGQTVADRYRADLEAAGIGKGCHAFSFALPQGLSPDIDHRIEVRREDDWSVLKGAPALLEPGHGLRATTPH
jgi:hypothetical protein